VEGLLTGLTYCQSETRRIREKHVDIAKERRRFLLDDRSLPLRRRGKIEAHSGPWRSSVERIKATAGTMAETKDKLAFHGKPCGDTNRLRKMPRKRV
jgi:hypothetical protein